MDQARAAAVPEPMGGGGVDVDFAALGIARRTGGRERREDPHRVVRRPAPSAPSGVREHAVQGVDSPG